MISRYAKPLSLAVLSAFACCAAPALAITSGGGFAPPAPPTAGDVICLSGCTQIRSVSPGGTVQITGTNLGGAEVSFAGKPKRIRVPADSSTATQVVATVPEGAVTGKLRVVSGSGTSNFTTAKLTVTTDVALARNTPLTITDAATTPAKAYQYGKKRPKLNFIVNGGRESTDLRIDVTSSTGEVVASKFRKAVPTGSTQSIGWDGKTSAGKIAKNGSYRFVVRSIDGTEATLSKGLAKASRRAARGKVADPFGFRMYGYVFPVRGPHTYGDGIGAGRGHQGIDILAKCGTPIFAARGGTVYYNDYQAGGAGNYLVIDTFGNGGKSQVYMHMPARSRFKVGQKVKTGQKIGLVGTTGRSSACHLHFEQWSGPGWYQGGSFMDPEPLVKRWDKYS